MNQRGQAIVETLLVVLLVVFLATLLMRMAYITWANLVVDRENHRLVLCTLGRQETSFCEHKSFQKLPKLLFGFGELRTVRAHLQKNLDGYYQARGQIIYVTSFGSIKSDRSLREQEILKASRRWRW